MGDSPGAVVLFGSGETSAGSRPAWDWVFRRLPAWARVAILETPAGFELNSAQVAGRVGEFLEQHLQSFRPRVAVVPARGRGTPSSPDDPDIARLVHGAGAVFLGPGSPTYAARQLRGSLTWQTVVAGHRLGAHLVLASAAAIAAGAEALPVYEIYKAGLDLHWQPGLDLLAPHGLHLVIVPHWNNHEGGASLDTSRCFMGRERFQVLLGLLPPNRTVVGIDEHTALILDLDAGTGLVLGAGGVSIGPAGRHVEHGERLDLNDLGPLRRPDPQEGLPPGLVEQVRAALACSGAEEASAPAEVLSLLAERDAARARRDWPAADALRQRIWDMGWRVEDGPEGSRAARRG